MAYLLKILYLLMFGLLVMLTYYYGFSFHRETFDGSYVGYIWVMWVLYVCYKTYQSIFHKEKITFTPLILFAFFLLQLLLLSILFFVLNDLSAGLWKSLFFKIVGYLFLPFVLTIVSIWLGKKILSFIKWWEEETSIFQFLSALWIGFFVFVTSLTLFWMVWLYNFWMVFLLIWIFGSFAGKQIQEICINFVTYKIEIPNHQTGKWWFEFINSRLLSAEFFFIIITFLVSINLINATRPMPIGWDDLWVYMNFPQLMAQSWELLNLWGMYAWQVFTGIWYMFQSPTQAFFLNNLGWILAGIVIVLSFTDLLKSKNQTLLHIPLLAGMMFMSMPMIIFQQAKDMKIDPGLFFVSGIVIYMVLYLFLKYLWYREVYKTSVWDIIQETNTQGASLEIMVENVPKTSFLQYFSKYQHIGIEDLFSQKKYILLIWMIGLLAGFAFTLKFTSLLLISGILWVLFYAKLWVAWFLWYVSLYIGIFTKAWLWELMNVVAPKDDIWLINSIFFSTLLLSWILFLYSWQKYSLKSLQQTGVLVSIFLFWTWIWVSPWVIKNISESKNFSISALLSGSPVSTLPDYSEILTSAEKEYLDTQHQNTRITEDGTTTNEDLWRYFWYETGINNYMKLPYNLTMQSNQRWEFTDITYWYLAFIPVVLLFLSYKYRVLTGWVFVMSLFPLIFFFSAQIDIFLRMFWYGLPNFLLWFPWYVTEIFSKMELPWWYIILVLFFLLPFLYLLYALNREKFSVLFKINAVFSVFYIFLWSISAYGIVWYGIAMYYSLLLIIALWIHGITFYEKTAEWKQKIFWALWTGVVIFLVISYTFQSTFPHGMTNLKTAWYYNFKAGTTDTYSSIFDAQMKYFDVLLELNIAPEKQPDLFHEILEKSNNTTLIQIIENNSISSLSELHQLFVQLSQTPYEVGNIQTNAIIDEAKILRKELYKNVLYPKNSYKNTAHIYRIGTFLRYFIADNYKRMFEDSLIFEFDTYFYDASNIDASIEKMEKLWVHYFLVDLNAATIDKDPRRALTKRYEALLTTFTSEKIELVSTDSLCLQTALETYQFSQKTPEDFQTYLNMAGVNYESYDNNGNLVLNRYQKLMWCYNTILDLMQNQKVTQNQYVHLLGLQNYLSTNDPESSEELSSIFTQYVPHGWMVLFKIKK